MYECARKKISRLHFRSKRELIEALAVRNPEWPEFADRLWFELFMSHEEKIAMLGTIEDGPLIRGTWVCEIGGVVKMYFALMDDEEIEDYAECLVDRLADLRKYFDGDGNVLWDGIEPVVWRPATQDP